MNKIIFLHVKLLKYTASLNNLLYIITMMKINAPINIVPRTPPTIASMFVGNVTYIYKNKIKYIKTSSLKKKQHTKCHWKSLILINQSLSNKYKCMYVFVYYIDMPFCRTFLLHNLQSILINRYRLQNDTFGFRS